MKEIERKFLLTFDQGLHFANIRKYTINITQAYLANTDDRDIRVRLERGESTIYQKQIVTVKTKSTSGIRDEVNIKIDETEANELLSMVPKSQHIHKSRYVIEGHFDEHPSEDNPRCITIDQFKGANLGLILLEAELLTPDTSIDDLLPFVTKEVTDDKRFYNSYLSEHPYTTWS